MFNALQRCRFEKIAFRKRDKWEAQKKNDPKMREKKNPNENPIGLHSDTMVTVPWKCTVKIRFFSFLSPSLDWKRWCIMDLCISCSQITGKHASLWINVELFSINKHTHTKSMKMAHKQRGEKKKQCHWNKMAVYGFSMTCFWITIEFIIIAIYRAEAYVAFFLFDMCWHRKWSWQWWWW